MRRWAGRLPEWGGGLLSCAYGQGHVAARTFGRMADTKHVLPSGEQWRIEHGEWSAVVVEVGGGLRDLTRAQAPLIHGYAEHEASNSGRGQVLVPWPNRIADGTYVFGGCQRQLALTEPERHNASHGLVSWVRWQVREASTDRIVVGTILPPQPGWDWILDVATEYTLDDDGLRVVPTVTNLGRDVAPFGYGAHPYLTAGETRVDSSALQVPARSRLLVDPERLLPDPHAVPVPVEAAVDFRSSRLLGGTELDVAFTELVPDKDGCWRVRLQHGERETVLWADAEAFPWVQVFTGDPLPEPLSRVSGVAVEPMTCPARAFETGRDLINLQPGGTWTGRWGITG